jgi:hypothetical protein
LREVRLSRSYVLLLLLVMMMMMTTNQGCHTHTTDTSVLSYPYSCIYFSSLYDFFHSLCSRSFFLFGIIICDFCFRNFIFCLLCTSDIIFAVYCQHPYSLLLLLAIGCAIFFFAVAFCFIFLCVATTM